MKQLSIRQPYVHFILSGLKTYEFRSWKTDYRGPVLIHVSKKRDSGEHLPMRLRERIPLELPTGGFVGVVDIVDVEDRGDTGELHFRYAWKLKNPRRIKFIPALGSLGLRDAPRSLMRYAR